MLSVLIADDEPKIRHGLRSTIESLVPDMKVVAEAEDGEEALSSVQSLRPDVLLIDIRMPFLDGLELIERVNSLTHDCVIIVVTGHDEFEYAKRALQLKVFDFILKPVSQEQLIGVLARGRDDLLSRRNQNRYEAWARKQLEINLGFLRESFMRGWLSGRFSQSEIDQQLDFLGLKVTAVRGMLVAHVVERVGSVTVNPERDRAVAVLTVRNIVEESLQEFELQCIFQDTYDNVVALCATAQGERWLDALPTIRTKAAGANVPALVLTQATVTGGLDSVPDVYESLVAEAATQSESSAITLRVHAFLEESYFRDDLSLEATSAALKLSPGYLSRALKQQSGLSFIEYLTRLRVAKATLLMSDPSVKIYEVAEMVGFSSQHYFSRAFRRVVGIPPVDFRKGGAQ